MHELSIAQNILEIVRGQMEKAGAGKLRRVALTVGPFADVNSGNSKATSGGGLPSK